MTERAKAVLVFGLNQSGESELDLIQPRGYKVLMFKAEISLQEALQVDLPVEMDLNNEEAVIAKALDLQAKYDIQAVFTLNEYRVALAARVAEALQLPNGLSYEAALNCRNKKRTREQLAKHGVGSAVYALVRTPEEALEQLENFSLPVVVKPSNEAGSTLVSFCHSAEDVRAAVEAIRANRSNWVGQQMDDEILMEEFLEGPEFSVEACTASGKTTVLAITAKRTSGAVEAGHLVPAPLPESTVQEVQQLVVEALSALGVNGTVTHTEVKLTPVGPKIIEVNARPGGDRIHLLVLAVTGYNLQELSLHLALGGTLEDAPRHAVQTSSAAIRFFEAGQDGLVTYRKLEDVESMPGVQRLVLHAKSGDAVKRTTSNYDRVGYAIVHAVDDQDADQVANEVERCLDVRVSPLAEGVTH
ncbi:ATP-grasp domain-containing protein [Tumebacillus sp. ITR2]|uniref:ATP-grasp domain-containing protein n=1 Tax=Tumebacillus amylolyticus TaxID=2801339 RepID=A0ABS1JFS1_9BACL|nr:ATP-grasp domain-containing protein [Tumebacillus amylolyticus]MBL0389138.1 ATP-grasp domain-containing protein [Tumebacillus amylolyticus]